MMRNTGYLYFHKENPGHSKLHLLTLTSVVLQAAMSKKLNLEISQLPLLVNGLDLHESLHDQKNNY